jgi:branched-subunit amino acid permease
MAIVVNNPAETREVDTSGSDAVSWMMAVAVIIILAIGAFYLLPRIAARSTPTPQAPGANINVTLPSNTGAGAGTGGATGGTSGGTQAQ